MDGLQTNLVHMRPVACRLSDDVERTSKGRVDATSKRGDALEVLKRHWKGKKLNSNTNVYVCESILALSAVYLL